MRWKENFSWLIAFPSISVTKFQSSFQLNWNHHLLAHDDWALEVWICVRFILWGTAGWGGKVDPIKRKAAELFWVSGGAFIIESWEVFFSIITKFYFDHLSQGFSAQVWGSQVSCRWGGGIDPSAHQLAQAPRPPRASSTLIRQPQGAVPIAPSSTCAKRQWRPGDTALSCHHSGDMWLVELPTGNFLY